MQLHEIHQPVGWKEIGKEYREVRWRIKDLCLDVSEKWHPAIGVRIPKRELSGAPRSSDEGGERQVIVAKIPRDHIVRRENHFAIKDQDLRQQDQQCENPILHSPSL